MEKLTGLQEKIIDCIIQGLPTSEIANKLSCSVSSVKKIRANKKLLAAYVPPEPLAHPDPLDVIRASLPMMIKSTQEIISDKNTSATAKLNASKQLMDIIKLSKELIPPEDITIRIIYGREGEENEHENENEEHLF